MSGPPDPKRRKIQEEDESLGLEKFRMEIVRIIDPRWFEHYVGKRKRKRNSLMFGTQSGDGSKRGGTERPNIVKDEISVLFDRKFEDLNENEKLKLLFSLKSPNERHGVTQCLSKVHFSILRKIFRSYIEERVLSKRNIVESLISKFYGEIPDFAKRKMERSNLESMVDHEDFRFKRLCGILIPRHVLLRIFSFVHYNRKMLVGIGGVCKMFYVAILSSWPRVRIYKRTLYQISLLVLKSVQKITLLEETRADRFIQLELDYLWDNVSPSRLRSLTIFASIDEIKRLFNDLIRRKKISSGEITLSPNSRKKRRNQSSTTSLSSLNGKNNPSSSSSSSSSDHPFFRKEYVLQRVEKLKILTKRNNDPQTFLRTLSFDWSASQSCPYLVEVLPNIQTVINPMKLEMLYGCQLKHIGLTVRYYGHHRDIDPQYELYSVEKFKKYVWAGTKMLTLNLSSVNMEYIEGLVSHLINSVIEIVINIKDLSSPTFNMHLFRKCKNLELLSITFSDCTCGEVRGSRHGSNIFDHMNLKHMIFSENQTSTSNKTTTTTTQSLLSNNNFTKSSSSKSSSRKFPTNCYMGVSTLNICRSAVSCVEFGFGLLIRCGMLWDPKLVRFFGRCMAMENDPKLLDETLRMMTLFLRQRLGGFEKFVIMIDCQLAYPEGISKGQYVFSYNENRKLRIEYYRHFNCSKKGCFLPCVTIFHYFNERLRELEDLFDFVSISVTSRDGKVFDPPQESLLPEDLFMETHREIKDSEWLIEYARKSRIIQ